MRVIVALLLAPSLVEGLFLPFQGAKKDCGDRIVARINDQIITNGELDGKLEGTPNATAAFRRSVLLRMAEDMLLQQEAKRNGITVSDDDVTALLDREAKRVGGEKKFAAYVRSLGITMAAYRAQRRKDIMVQRLYGRIAWSGLYGKGDLVLVDEVSPQAVREFYLKNKDRFQAFARVTIRRIALEWTTPKMKEAKYKFARSLRRRLKMGINFDVQARMSSEKWWTRDDKPDGEKVFFLQDLKRENELFSKETMDKLFSKDLKIGDLTGIIEDGNTLNLFLLVARSERETLPFEEAQIDIRNELRSKQRIRNKRLVLNELIKRAYYWPKNLFQKPSE